MIKTWEVWLLAAGGVLVGFLVGAFVGASASPNDDIPAFGTGLSALP